MRATDYRDVADAVAAEIAAGTLRPGDRLPPQRDFAYARGIAVSTASRVYAELGRRGLTTGEVGRGTFVRSEPGRAGTLQPEPPPAALDLQRTHSRLPEQEAVLAETLAALARGGAEIGFSQYGPDGTPRARAVAARFLTRDGYAPKPADILFTGNGRQALAAALAALAAPGERIGCEPLTYPAVRGIASRLGITLVPLAMDAEGVCPDAILQAHRATPLSGVYLQPTLQNPLGTTMSPARRVDLARVLDQTGLTAIEDAVYGFLADTQPLLASLAPDRTILVDSLSKRVMPALTIGMIAGPPHLTDRLAASVRQGAWTVLGLSLAAGMHWMAGGSAATLAEAKRRDAASRQALARDILAGLKVVGDPRAYHLWLELPETWRAEAFAAASLRRGIALLPAPAFAVNPGHAPNAVRLALATPSREDLAEALQNLRRLAVSEDDQVVE
ncbi:PLP-dependent aminotransferase family protein [Methylobacterium sp. J-048]|uniref:aminotransferase-like domain-containing protein n=1 Tax=Methylobacterium sp. J-048 TaxID=2836635 RepID=UPI001FBB92DF|nr:PLP-dependent aminotransferase family protein [Methylobacterium sp. J-048]